MLSHHLTDETLQDYASGVLNSSMETLIACHLTVCPVCRQRADMADAIGGICLDGQNAAPMIASADDILALNKSADSTTSTAAASQLPAGPGIPRPLARLLPAPLDELPWKSFGPGLKQYNLGNQPRKEGAFKLLSIDPGSRMSKHTHQHRELTFIVSGSYSDELGKFKAGDIADLSADHHHTPYVDSDIPCISLIATDAPVKFDSLFGKIVQPFVGI